MKGIFDLVIFDLKFPGFTRACRTKPWLKRDDKSSISNQTKIDSETNQGLTDAQNQKSKI
jgi:hypothetical protein